MKEILVIFQCCKKKRDVELYPDKDFDLASYIPRTKGILEKAVTRFSLEGVIDVSSRPVARAILSFKSY